MKKTNFHVLPNGHVYFHVVQDYTNYIYVDLPLGTYLIGTFDENMPFNSIDFITWFDSNHLDNFYALTGGDIL